MITISIPELYEAKEQDSKKTFIAYKLEIVLNREKKTLEKRYSQFYELYKAVKKMVKHSPEMPPKLPKSFLNKNDSLLEDRRRGLEQFLQELVVLSEDSTTGVAEELFNFLELKLPTLPADVNESNINFLDDIDGYVTDETYKPTHQPILSFTCDPFVNAPPVDESEDCLPDIIAQGVYNGLYNDDSVENLPSY